MTGSENGQVTGTRDKDYDIIWFTEACLSNALRLEAYIRDAEREGDTELATLFPQGPGREPQGRRARQAAAAQAAGRLTGRLARDQHGASLDQA